MNLVFMGTPDFAVPCLKSILKAQHNVMAVFTQPDKPKGRGYVLTAPPVKECALENGLTVYQPVTLKGDFAYNIIKNLNPDAIVVVAYGNILPKSIIDLPKYGCINVHGSLLPKYRGAAPIQWAVLNGDTQTGITTMLMDEGLDTGDMLFTSVTDIGENETAGELFDRLKIMGSDLIVKTLEELKKGNIIAKKQNNENASYAPMLNKSMCVINWNNTAQQIHNQIRGLSPWPVAATVLKNKKLKVHSSLIAKGKGKPGEIINTNPLIVACGEGAVEITELQLEGKKRMSSKNFIMGHQLKIGESFG